MKKYFLIFFILFADVIAGPLVTYGLLPDTVSYMFILPLILVFSYPFKWSGYYTFSILFVTYFFFNAFVNHQPLILALSYSKYALFPLIIYYLTDLDDYNLRSRKILNLLIIIGVMQLPVVFIQTVFYNELLEYTITDVIWQDITTGTFWFKNDPALNFFLISLISYLLFEETDFRKITKISLIFYFTVTVFLSNSQLSMVILLLIFGYAMVRRLNFQNVIIYTPILLLLLFCIYLFMGELILEKMEELFRRATNQSDGAMQRFLEGGYSRTAALIYFASEPLKLVGDGVGKYVDLSTNAYSLGLRGQLFIFYAEIGLFGLGYSLFLCFYSIKSIVHKINAFHIVLISMFAAYGYTARPFTDLSILLTVFLLARISANHSQNELKSIKNG